MSWNLFGHRYEWHEFISCGRRYRRCVQNNELQAFMLIHNGSDKAWVPVTSVSISGEFR